MVSEGYDHIVAMVIVSMIFIGTVVALPAINYANMQTMDQQQLRNAALNVFDSMLLDVGSPSNWGSDPTQVGKFGLALADPFSKYVLDVDKVQRINETNPTGFIAYEDIRTLLNIEEDYGFQLTLSRPFEVDWDLKIEANDWVRLNVTVTRTEDGTPIPNAEVRVTTTATVKKDDTYSLTKLDPITRYTNSSGMCEERQEFVVDGDIDQVVSFMQISVAGMLTTAIARSSDPFNGLVNVYTSGDFVTLSIPQELIDIGTPATQRIIKIAAYKDGVEIPLFQAGPKDPEGELHWNSGASDYFWTREIQNLRTLNPTALLFWVRITLKAPTGGNQKDGDYKPGNQVVMLSGSLDFGSTGNIFSSGADPKDENPIVTMRRLVVISDMTYVAQFLFWREQI